MLDEGIAERQAALVHQHDLADAAARRIGLQAPELVGRAVIEAQAAVHAVSVVLVRGNVRAGKSAARLGVGSLLCDRGCFVHSLISRQQSVPAPGRSSGRRNFSPGASTQNQGAAGPRQPPAKFSADLDTIPTSPTRSARVRCRWQIHRRSLRPLSAAPTKGLSSARTRRRKYLRRGRAQQNPNRAARQGHADLRSSRAIAAGAALMRKIAAAGTRSIISMGNSRS